MSRCCNEFSRSSLLRRAVAETGSGLPLIEPSCRCRGTGLDRRDILLRSAGLALAVYGAGPSTSRLRGRLLAAAEAAPAQPVSSLFLDGGADSLSLLAPVGDPDYRRLRPRLALPDSSLVFTEDPRLRWHPEAEAFRTLHLEGKLSVLPTVGYTDADQSHFTSRHYWEVGATNTGLRTGWMGRYLDRAGRADNPLQGLSLDGELAPPLATAKAPVARSMSDGYRFWAGCLGRGRDQNVGDNPSARCRARLAGQGPRLGCEHRAPVTPASASTGASERKRHHEPGRLPEAPQRVPTAPRRARGDAGRRPSTR